MMSKILLIEDNKTTNFISKLALKSVGIETVDEVFNGMEACQYLQKICPDVIFLDLNMPVMDGWEFLEEIEIKQICRGVKIAILTSSRHPNDIKRSKFYPSVIAYLEKPLTKEKIETVRNTLDGL